MKTKWLKIVNDLAQIWNGVFLIVLFLLLVALIGGIIWLHITKKNIFKNSIVCIVISALISSIMMIPLISAFQHNVELKVEDGKVSQLRAEEIERQGNLDKLKADIQEAKITAKAEVDKEKDILKAELDKKKLANKQELEKMENDLKIQREQHKGEMERIKAERESKTKEHKEKMAELNREQDKAKADTKNEIDKMKNAYNIERVRMQEEEKTNREKHKREMAKLKEEQKLAEIRKKEEEAKLKNREKDNKIFEQSKKIANLNNEIDLLKNSQLNMQTLTNICEVNLVKTQLKQNDIHIESLGTTNEIKKGFLGLGSVSYNKSKEAVIIVSNEFNNAKFGIDLKDVKINEDNNKRLNISGIKVKYNGTESINQSIPFSEMREVEYEQAKDGEEPEISKIIILEDLDSYKKISKLGEKYKNEYQDRLKNGLEAEYMKDVVIPLAQNFIRLILAPLKQDIVFDASSDNGVPILDFLGEKINKVKAEKNTIENSLKNLSQNINPNSETDSLLHIKPIINDELYNQVNEYYKQGEYEKAFALLKILAEQGDVDAQYKIASWYFVGRGVNQDINKSLEWYIKSANNGDADAQHELGIIYYYGQNVEQNDAEAVKWFTKAAEQGNGNAQFLLGQICTAEKKYSEAVKWYKKAAEKNHIDAMISLGECYYYGLGGEGVNYPEAYMLFKGSVDYDSRNAEATYSLARCYFHGHGVDKDIDKAKELARKAIELDDTITDTDGILE